MSLLVASLFAVALAQPTSFAAALACPSPQELPAATRAALEQAAAAEAAGEAVRAEELLRAALDGDERSVALHVALGRFLYVNGNGAEGLGLLWRATELGPKDVAAAGTLADALLAERDFYESEGDTANADANLLRAKEVLDRVRNEPAARDSDYRTRRVRVLLRVDGGGEEAYALAAGLLEEAPDDLERHALLNEAAAAGRAIDAALAWYDAHETEPWVAAWFRAGLLAARATANYNNFVDDEKARADYIAAEEQMQLAARANPEFFDAASERISFYRSWSGWILHRQERYEEAFDLFISAWGRNPANDNAITGVFWICGRWYELGNLDAAREGYRQACTLAPQRPEFWNNYALLCRDTGHYEESFKAYRRTLELTPDDPRIVNDCALILQYHLKRDLDLAERWYIRAEDLSRANLAVAENEGDVGRAAEQRAILGDALVNLARLYGDQGKIAESAEHWNELRAIDPTRDELPENQPER